MSIQEGVCLVVVGDEMGDEVRPTAEPGSRTGTSTANSSGADLSAGAKAGILVEALPYIRRFWGRTVVVKYGGNALGGGSDLADFATDIVLMRVGGHENRGRPRRRSPDRRAHGPPG